MNRFAQVKKKDHAALRNILLPLLFFAAAVAFLLVGVRSVSGRSEEERLKSVKQAVTRAAVHCYAVEGTYPPGLDYLEEQYGLMVDKEKYFVDYQSFASNVMPDITVVERDSARIAG